MARSSQSRKFLVALLIIAQAASFTFAASAAARAQCAGHAERAAALSTEQSEHAHHGHAAPAGSDDQTQAPITSDFDCCPLHCGGMVATVEPFGIAGWLAAVSVGAGHAMASGDHTSVDPPPRSLL